MKLWWLQETARVGAEKAAVERIVSEEGWFAITKWRINGFRFSVDGVITAHGMEYPVSLIYPDQFPSVPAWVEPQDTEARWSRHQYGKGGSLCLELRPDNWSPEATGADMLRSAYHLLQAENPLGEKHGEVVSAHAVGELQSYDWGRNPVFIGSGCFERIQKGAAENVRALRWPTDDDVWPIYVFDDKDCSLPSRPPTVNSQFLQIELPVVIGHGDSIPDAPADRMAVTSAVAIDIDPAFANAAVLMIVVGKASASVFHSIDESNAFPRKWVVLPDEQGIRSGRTDAALAKKVAVVGVGSLGSKVSEILLRSGICHQMIVDGDVFLPVNLERHVLDWRDVGFRKANAMKRRLLHIMPGAEISPISSNLNWQRAAKTHAQDVEALGSCDLIINATGDVPTALLLGAIAAENGKPFVSAEVFEGGLGALLCRSIPGVDPTYAASRCAYSAYCDEMGVEPPPSGFRTYEALTESGKPITADDAAVSIAAAHTARLVLDILDGCTGPDDTAWLLIGCRKGWLFSGHGHTISLDVGPAPSPRQPEEDAAARLFVEALAREVLDAAETSG